MSYMFDRAKMKQARLAAGLTQDQLAWHALTSQRNIVRWEQGHNVPRPAAVARIAEATGHPVEFFHIETESADDEPAGVEEALVNDLLAVIRQIVRAETKAAA